MTKLQLHEIHKDERGAIYLLKGNVLIDYDEITIFVTNKGYARGGCIHNINDEYCVVLEGTIKYWIGNGLPEIYRNGMAAFIPSGTPHYFVAQTDCLVMEFGATAAEKKEKHLGFRKKVDEINAKRN